ncbi:hypothetical protein [Desulforhopalus sp. 52FAK]
MIDLNISYLNQGIISTEYLDTGLISVDENVIHFGKHGNKTLFFLVLLTGLPTLLFMIFYLIPIANDDLLKVFLILVTAYLACRFGMPLTDMFFRNQIDVDFVKREILTTNVFGKKKKWLIQNLSNIKFSHGVYWGSRRHFYKIILIDQKKKFIVIRGIPFEKEARNLCAILNTFTCFVVGEKKCDNIQVLKDLSLI